VLDLLGELRLAASDGHLHALASVLNLVAWAPDPAAADAVEELMAALPDHHPSRVVIVSPGAAGPGIDAQVVARCGLREGGAGPMCVEEVSLTLPASVVPHAASAVEPLLRADLPIVLWWPSAPDPDDAAFRGLLGLADRLTTEADRLGDARRAVRMLAGRIDAGDPVMTDLAWAALTPWRQLVAQVLRGEDLVRLRRGPTRVRVEHPGRGTTVGALLLAGWLRTELGDRALVACMPGADGADEALVALEVEGPDGWRMRVERRTPLTGTVTVEDRGGGPRRRVLPLPRHERAGLLAGELELQRRDLPFERAVARAVELACA
jgi:hypothetical protein